MSPFNRLAWIASMALAFSLPIGYFIPTFGLFGVIIGIIIGIFIKKIFLPNDLFEDISVKKKSHTKTASYAFSETEEEKEEDQKEEIYTPYQSDIQKRTVLKKETIKTTVYTKPKPHKPNPLVVWFSENTLAKLGGILIFLAVLAFLTVIYTAIGPVGRLIISL